MTTPITLQSGFDRHGITHTSPSQINTWRNAPDVWLVEKLYGYRGPTSPAAARGIAVEHGIVCVLKGASMEAAQQEALREFNRLTALNVSDKVATERAAIEPMIKLAVEALAPLGRPDLPDAGQRKVELTCNGGDWRLPMIGYVDLPYDSQGLIVDLKTTLRMPSEMSLEHATQASFYQRATNCTVRFLYVTPKGVKWMEPADAVATLAEAKLHLIRQERFLRLGEREQLAAIMPVSPGTFYWNGLEAARRDVYGV